jgi:hypothetical protein
MLHERNRAFRKSACDYRNLMLVIFKHGQRYGLLPRTQEANLLLFVRPSCVSEFEPVVLTLAQCVEILANLNDMHRVLVLADAARNPSRNSCFCAGEVRRS